MTDARQQRVEAISERFRPGIRGAWQVHVLRSTDVAAYGCPDGSIFVTDGLLSLMTDEEVSAAMAHEMGHLLADGHLQTIVGLRGCGSTPNVEMRADALGVALLESRGLGASSMLSMLQKVRGSATVNESVRRAIDQRIRLLQLALPQRSAEAVAVPRAASLN